MGDRWDDQVEDACNHALERVCSTEGDARTRAWRELVLVLAPHVEGWADGSWLLRRWRLRSEDSARAILVEVLSRLAANDYANLARYRARSAPGEAELADDQLDAIEQVARLREGDEPPGDAGAAYPFRAWLLRLLAYAIKDYIRQRLGWAHDGEGLSKRDLGSEAARLSEAPEAASRPPFTDYVHVRQLLREIEAHAETFPAPMQRALAAWMRGTGYGEIAVELGLEAARDAEKLVRAAKARLREHFRESALA